MTTTRIREREPQTVALDAAYALAALVDETIEAVRTARKQAGELRADAPEKFEQFRTDAPARIESLPKDVEARLEQLREQASRAVDERLVEFESSFDAKAAAGAEVVNRVRADERVTRIEQAFKPVGDQAEIARRQVKGAVTSIRKTVEVAVEAGRTQADNAATQVKAAATSTRRTVETAAGQVRGIAS